MDNMEPKISVFDYTDYRKYLKEYYEEKKRTTKSFSYRFFSRKAGFNSIGLYKDVVEKRRDLGKGLISRFVHGLDLQPKEAEYFENMVFCNEAQTTSESSFYFKRMMSIYESRAYKVNADQYEYYTHWYYSAIRAMLDYTPFTGDYTSLATALKPPITNEQAQRAIEILEKLELIEKDEEGVYRNTHHSLTGRVQQDDERIEKINIIHFQKEMLKMGEEAYDRHKVPNLDMSTMTLSISEETYQELKKELADLRQKFSNLASRDKKANRVYQLNCHFFPLALTEDSQ